MTALCRYLAKSDEEYVIDERGREAFVPVERRDYSLCTWADDSPEGVAALTNAPRWLQRNALGGHLWRPGDCENCPGYRAEGGKG